MVSMCSYCSSIAAVKQGDSVVYNNEAVASESPYSEPLAGGVQTGKLANQTSQLPLMVSQTCRHVYIVCRQKTIYSTAGMRQVKRSLWSKSQSRIKACFHIRAELCIVNGMPIDCIAGNRLLCLWTVRIVCIVCCT